MSRILTLLLALAGLAVSLYLTWTHQQVAANPEFQSFCNINATFNCDLVNASRFAEVWGIPLALYGAGFYVAVFILGLASLGSSERARNTPSVIWGLAVAAVFLSAVLAFLSATEVGAWCVMCISLYVINAALLATSWASLGEGIGAIIGILDDELRGLLRNPALFAAGVAFAGTLWLGSVVFAAPAPKVATKGVDQPAISDTDVVLEMYRRASVIDVPLTGEEPFKGGSNASVVVVEFADFGCPWCSKAADALYEVAETFGDRVKIIYKHFPLDNKCNPMMSHALHENACAASTAAICAGQQGQFWPMHKMLFANQEDQAENDLVDYASGLGLDMDAWNACRQSAEAATTISADVQAADVVKVEGTPTIFINGRLIKGGAVARADLLSTIIQALLDGSL